MNPELRAYYLAALPSRIEALEAGRRSAAEGDDDACIALRKLAHSLKGSGASYGFARISDAAAAAEKAADVELDARVLALIEAMRDAIAAGPDADEHA